MYTDRDMSDVCKLSSPASGRDPSTSTAVHLLTPRVTQGSHRPRILRWEYHTRAADVSHHTRAIDVWVFLVEF